MSEQQSYADFASMTEEEVIEWFLQERDWASIPPKDLKVGIIRAIRIILQRNYQ